MLGSLLAIVSSLFSAIGLTMVSILIDKFGVSITSVDNYWEISLVWISCSLCVVTDSLIFIFSKNGKKNNNIIEELGSNILMSSISYCFYSVGYIYVAHKLGSPVQSVLDSTQILFLIILLSNSYKEFGNLCFLLVGVCLYICGIYFLSTTSTSSTTSSTTSTSMSTTSVMTWILSLIVVLLMTYNGILFEKASRSMDIIQYMLMQSIICYIFLSILVVIIIPLDLNYIKGVYVYATIRHLVNIFANYSEAFSIKLIGYYKFVMIQTFVYPCCSIALHYILSTNGCSLVTIAGLSLIFCGLWCFYNYVRPVEMENNDEESTPLLAFMHDNKTQTTLGIHSI
jgi:uncharacterized membrane protein YidH (DUF202 family)